MADLVEAEVAALEARIAVLERRLRLRQIQLAAYGALDAPPYVIIDKEAAEQELAAARLRLRRLRPSTAARPPYQGLLTFQEDNAGVFFGRDALVVELTACVARAPFLAVLGSSGSGKSSVVRAGLVPDLKGGALPGSERWRYVILKPGPRPLDTLAAALARLQGSDLSGALALRDRLIASDQPASLLLAAEMLLDRDTGQRLVLVVDQFEELWTLAPVEPAARDTWIAQQRQPFVRLLVGAMPAPVTAPLADLLHNAPVTAILTMRADFLHRAAEDPALARLIGEHDVIVGPMTTAELTEAVVHPAELAGGGFEPGLVEELVGQSAGRPGALPLLQQTLLELWLRRAPDGTLTWDAYRAIGGVPGAIEQQAETFYTGLDPASQAICRRVLLGLIQPGQGTDDTRRRSYLRDLAPSSERTAEIEPVVQTLASARLVTTTGGNTPADRTVDLAHEALIAHWPRLRRWIDDERAVLLARRRLHDDATLWNSRGRDASYLYRGAALAEARQLAETGELGELAFAFVQAAATADQAARRRRQRQQLAAAALALLMVIIGVVFAIQYAQQQARIEVLRGFWEPPDGLNFNDPAVVLVAANDGDPAPRFYLGSANIGVGRSDDTRAWTFFRRGLPEGPPENNDPAKTVFNITRLALDPLDRRRLLAGVLDHGIYRSGDGGENWTAARGAPTGKNGVYALSLHGNWALAVFRPEFRPYVSSDGGTTWSALGGGGLPTGRIYGVAIPPGFGTAYIGAEQGVYRSSLPSAPASGWRWERAPGLPPALLIVPGTPPDRSLYLAGAEIASEARWPIYRLTPGGQLVLLGKVPDQPRALAPGAHTTYALLNTGAVMALRPGEAAVQLAPGDGLAFDILALPRPDGGTRLLLGSQRGLLEYRLPLGGEP